MRTMSINIATTIRKFRLIKGIKQLDVANKCGISASYLSLIESGKRRINLTMIEKISKALKIPMSVIIFSAYDRKKIKKMDRELYDKFSLFMMNILTKP